MTTITIADELIEEAKRFGWNEKTLTDEFSQFIRSKISLMKFRTATDNAQDFAKKEKKPLSADVARVAGFLKDEIGKAKDNDDNLEELAMLNMILADDNTIWEKWFANGEKVSDDFIKEKERVQPIQERNF